MMPRWQWLLSFLAFIALSSQLTATPLRIRCESAQCEEIDIVPRGVHEYRSRRNPGVDPDAHVDGTGFVLPRWGTRRDRVYLLLDTPTRHNLH